MSDIGYCQCLTNKPHDKSPEGWLIHRSCGLIIACDMNYSSEFGEEDDHPATTTHLGYTICDKHLPIAINVWSAPY